MNKIINEFHDSTTVQIAVVTLDSSFSDREHFDDYTLQLANKWGVGDSIKNNGILIGISAELRCMRIHNGYGIEKIMSDSETKKIVDSVFIPRFKETNYYLGTLNGLEAITKHLSKK